MLCVRKSIIIRDSPSFAVSLLLPSSSIIAPFHADICFCKIFAHIKLINLFCSRKYYVSSSNEEANGKNSSQSAEVEFKWLLIELKTLQWWWRMGSVSSWGIITRDSQNYSRLVLSPNNLFLVCLRQTLAWWEFLIRDNLNGNCQMSWNPFNASAWIEILFLWRNPILSCLHCIFQFSRKRSKKLVKLQRRTDASTENVFCFPLCSYEINLSFRKKTSKGFPTIASFLFRIVQSYNCNCSVKLT